MSRPNAADWLVTTIGDYARFAANVLNGAGLPPAVYADMTKPQVWFEHSTTEAMGLGWEVMKGPPEDPVILMHTGSDDGIKTLVLLLPTSKRGIVIFTNGENGMDVVLKILKATLHMKELTP
jgi:CubicO group peptidase (beta-lactamase class C family)